MRTHNSERVSDWLGGCAASTLAQQYGTPLLVIDEQCLRSQMRAATAAFERTGWTACVTYAGKALLVAAIARIAHEEGLAVDVCSLGELHTALRAGVPASECIVHGCYKTAEELDAAVASRVRHVVVDHASEIGELGRRARAAGTVCDVLVRVNPGIAAPTHGFVQTGAPASKFGFPIADGQAMDAVRRAQSEQGLALSGIHCHLGSQIDDLTAYVRAIDALADFAERVHAQDGIILRVFDVGGGLAVGRSNDAYEPSLAAWADAVFGAFDRRFTHAQFPRPQIYVEPGRAIVGPAGTTLYRIGVRKQLSDGGIALIVDGGMSDNPRPALYQARYSVAIADRLNQPPDGTYSIFGRHCETDRLFPEVELPNPQPGDLLAVRDSGAYTYSMASNYNRFARPAVVLAAGGRARLIALREPLDHVLDLDVP